MRSAISGLDSPWPTRRRMSSSRVVSRRTLPLQRSRLSSRTRCSSAPAIRGEQRSSSRSTLSITSRSSSNESRCSRKPTTPTSTQAIASSTSPTSSATNRAPGSDETASSSARRFPDSGGTLNSTRSAADSPATRSASGSESMDAIRSHPGSLATRTARAPRYSWISDTSTNRTSPGAATDLSSPARTLTCRHCDIRMVREATMGETARPGQTPSDRSGKIGGMSAASALPPGPPLPALVQTALWLGSPTGFLERCARRYGDVFTLRLALGPPVVMVSDPALVERVLTLDAEAASTGEENAILAPLLGDRSVLRLDGPDHLRQRRLLLPFFHGERMRRQAGAIAAIVEASVAGWPHDRAFPLLPRLRDVTFEVILRVVFGLDESPQLDDLRASLKRLLRMGSSWMVVPALRRDLGPRSPWGRFVRLRAHVDALLREQIRRRREAAATGDGVIDVLLPEMDDAELVDALMTVLVAGHETTATSLAWCFELLLRRPDLVERLRDEPAGGPSRLLDAVIRETLRVRPVFRYTSRRLRRPLPLGEH